MSHIVILVCRVVKLIGPVERPAASSTIHRLTSRTFNSAFGAAICLVIALFCGSSAVYGQSATGVDTESKDVSTMTAEELANYIKVQQQQLDAVKQARDQQKAKLAEVEEALLQRQQKLNGIVTELSKLCSERKKLDPTDDEPCLPDES